jgi:hypothetical protein
MTKFTNLRLLAVLALASATAACSAPGTPGTAAQADAGWHAQPWIDEALRTPYTADVGGAFISNAPRGWYR